MRRAIVTALLVGPLFACDRVPSGAVTECNVSIVPSVKTDVLFVIDNSSSMAEEQVNLQANLDAFVTALKASPVAQDFHVGVTTPDVTNFSINPADGMPYPLTAGPGVAGALIGSPAVLDGASPTFVSDFQARVDLVGLGGRGWEQPFRAMKLALSDRIGDGTNAGFLRPGARLAVVFLSDEDDCSDSANPPVINAGAGATAPNGNLQCHNDNGDGFDYKAKIDAVAGYESFLNGQIGGEVRDLVLAAVVGVDPVAKQPTCGWDAVTVANQNNWCCGSASNNKCTANTSGFTSVTVPGPLAGTTWCDGEASGSACTSGCATAFDKGDRFVDLLGRFPAERTLTAAICSNFADTLAQLGCMLTPQDLPLQQAPADGRLLIVTVESGAATIPCTVDVAGSAGEASADVVYTPPQGGQPAKLHFQNDCQLTCGQKIDIRLVCAG
jgi:hypothetical protein